MADPGNTETPTESQSPAAVAVGAGESPEPAISDPQLVAVSPEVLANTTGEYFRAWGQRIRNGESGALPIIIGLIVIVVFFQVQEPKFLTAGNLVNLLEQASTYVMFGTAVMFVLIISEIDLAIGYTAAVGAFVIAELIAAPVNLPWWLGIIGGLAACGVLGYAQGWLITRLNLPSFIVTLAGYLGFLGLMLELAQIDKTAVGGVISIDSNSPVYKLVQNNMSTTLGWVVLIVALLLFAGATLLGRRRRQSQGLSTPPFGVTLLILGASAVGGIVLLLICNANRANGIAFLGGTPWVVPFVAVILVFYTWLLTKTRLGRYMYAIGANPEAARRAGINVNRIKTTAFVMCAVTAGIAGLIYESNQSAMATDINGGQLVLYGVGAAVIGGTSLFGGRGKPLHALLGGIVIATVFNGLGLMGISSAGTDIATAIVLIGAVTLDSLVRRRSSSR
jgi:D-xylose transport system permease protein